MFLFQCVSQLLMLNSDAVCDQSALASNSQTRLAWLNTPKTWTQRHACNRSIAIEAVESVGRIVVVLVDMVVVVVVHMVQVVMFREIPELV